MLSVCRLLFDNFNWALLLDFIVSDTLVETDFTNDALLVDAVQILTGKVVSYLFVSEYFTTDFHILLSNQLETFANMITHNFKNTSTAYVPLETVLFIWDQYMLGMNSPGFHEFYVPIVAAVFLMLLKEKLENCENVSNVRCMEFPLCFFVKLKAIIKEWFPFSVQHIYVLLIF